MQKVSRLSRRDWAYTSLAQLVARTRIPQASPQPLLYDETYLTGLCHVNCLEADTITGYAVTTNLFPAARAVELHNGHLECLYHHFSGYYGWHHRDIYKPGSFSSSSHPYLSCMILSEQVSSTNARAVVWDYSALALFCASYAPLGMTDESTPK